MKKQIKQQKNTTYVDTSHVRMILLAFRFGPCFPNMVVHSLPLDAALKT